MISEDRVEEIYKLVYSYCNKKSIFDEDIIQSMVWYVWETSVKHYDETKSQLSTFVYLVCTGYMNKLKRKKRVSTISLDDDGYVYNKNKSSELTPLQILIQQEDDEELKYLYDKCSDILKDWLNGETQEELAKKYGCCQTTISHRIRTEIKKLRNEVMSNV